MTAVVLGAESTFNNCCACVLRADGVVRYERSVTFRAPDGVAQDTPEWREHLGEFHARTLPQLLDEAVQAASDVDAVAFSVVDGKVNANVEIARPIVASLARRLSVPAVPVDHQEAHLLSGLMCDPPPLFPYVGLTAAGGHSTLQIANALGDYRVLGTHETAPRNRFGHGRAPGSVLDRCAELLGLVAPGQPDGAVAVDECGRRTTDWRYQRFPVTAALNARNGYDLDFHALYEEVLGHRRAAGEDRGELERLAVSAQECVMNILLDKAFSAAAAHGISRISFGGGVACNSRLRVLAAARAARANATIYFPPPAVCADNARMIAFAALLVRTGAGADEEGTPQCGYW